MTSILPASLPAAFLRSVGVSPLKPLVLFGGETVTYADMLGRVRDVSGRLAGWGLQRGNRVALYLENSPDFIAAYLGAQWMGAVVVLVNTRYRQKELGHILMDSGARLLVTDATGAREVAAIRDDLPDLEQVIELGAAGAWDRFSPPNPLDTHADLASDDVAVIAYTSGTTGRSKGAMLTHGNLVSNSEAVTTAWEWTADDSLLLVLPLFHIHGLGVGLHGTLLRGSTITLRSTFDAAEVMTELASGRHSMFFGVPTMYSRLLIEAEQTAERPRGLRLLVSGSAPLSPQVLADVEREFGLRILERYGMTETVMNLGNPLRGERKAGSVGIPFPGIEMRIGTHGGEPDTRIDSRREAPATWVGDEGKGAAAQLGNRGVGADESAETPEDLDNAPHRVGEVQLRGPNICKGYWQNTAATAEVWTDDGWFRTGDLGYQDADGYVFLTGRSKELIISGGFNVYPREVEEVLEEHPSIAEAAVLGLPDADLGERVVAAVVTSGDVSTAELQQFCRDRLAGFKKPREVHVVQSLPRNALGKVQKHLLRDELAASISVSTDDLS